MTLSQFDTRASLREVIRLPSSAAELRGQERARLADRRAAMRFFVLGAACFLPFLAAVAWAAGFVAAATIIGASAATGIVTWQAAVWSDKRRHARLIADHGVGASDRMFDDKDGPPRGHVPPA